MENNYKILISGDYNVFNENWNGAGIYMASGNYISEVFKLPIYIGSAIDLQKRIEDDHIHTLERNKHPHNPILQYAWNKHYEKEGFVWWLLETCAPETTLEREQYYLDLYRPFKDEFGGFNISHYAISGMKGRKHSEETKQKLSENHKGMHNSPETEFKKGMPSWNKGKKCSPQAREKLSNINKGHWLGDNNPNRKNPKFGILHPNFGKRLSEDTKQKMSNAKRGQISKRKKAVLCVETGMKYSSIKEAGEMLNISKGHISAVCSGKRQTCGGFHWKFIND